MNNNTYSKILLLLCFTLVFSCGPAEFVKPLIPLFPESDMSMIHGDDSRAWRITEVINKYYSPNDHLEVELECLEDDTYTFLANNEITIDLGESKCFGRNDDGIFTADVEIFEARLLYMKPSDADSETIFLEYARGYHNLDGTAQGVSLRWYKLAELTEDRMVFHREGGQYIGEYNEALIFERL